MIKVIAAFVFLGLSACAGHTNTESAPVPTPVQVPASGTQTYGQMAGKAPANDYYNLDNGRRAPFSILKTPTTSDWLVFIPGSGCDFRPLDQNHFIQWMLAKRDYNVLMIGKAGSDINDPDGKICRDDEFQHSSVRSQHIIDIQTIMKQMVPAGARVLLMAHSEGGYLMPDVAVADARVKAMIDISGNTKSWIDEEIFWLPPGPKRDALANFMNTKVRGNNSFTEKYEYWTYAWLNSMDTHQSYDMMMKLTIPILWMNGEKDDVLWIEGARQDGTALAKVKPNLDYEWILGAEHSLQCPDKTPSCDEAKLDAQVSAMMTSFAQAKF